MIRNKEYAVRGILFLVMTLTFLAALTCIPANLTLTGNFSRETDVHVFYSWKKSFSEKYSVFRSVMPDEETLHFAIPSWGSRYIRMDFGNQPGLFFDIKNVKITCFGFLQFEAARPHFEEFTRTNEITELNSAFCSFGNDPFIIFASKQFHGKIVWPVFFVLLTFYLLATIMILICKLDLLSHSAINKRWADSLEYCRRNFKWLVLAFVCILIVWGYELFQFTISIDDEFMLFSSREAGLGWIPQGRWGMALVFFLFGNPSIPVISLFLSLLCLLISYILIVKDLEISETVRLLLFGAFIASPIFYYAFTFSSLCPGTGFAILSATGAALLLFRAKDWRDFLPALLLGTFAVACYQSLIVLIPLLFLFFLVNDSLDHERNARYLLKRVFLILCFLAACLLAYVLINMAVLRVFAMQTSYITGLVALPNTIDEFQQFAFCLQKKIIWVLAGMFGEKIWGQSLLLCLVLFGMPVALFLQKKRFLQIILFEISAVLMLLLPFSLDIISKSAEMPLRSMLAFPFAVFLLLSFPFKYFSKTAIWRFLFAVGVFLLFMQYSCLINKFAYSNFLQFRNDQSLLQSVLDRLQRNPDFVKTLHTGRKIPFFVIGYKEENLATQYPFLKTETVGRSILSWDQGCAMRFASMLTMMGHPYFSGGTPQKYRENLPMMEAMPAWPAEESVLCKNGAVFLKFSDFSRVQITRNKIPKKMVYQSKLSHGINEVCFDHSFSKTVWKAARNRFVQIANCTLDNLLIFESCGNDPILRTEKLPTLEDREYLVTIRYSSQQDELTQIFYTDQNTPSEHGQLNFATTAGENIIQFRIKGRYLSSGLRIAFCDTPGRRIEIIRFEILEAQ